ncbi:hypothetical protein [Knoellia locipacati]|nr:hypothetical protein [Knoellia locipacati]
MTELSHDTSAQGMFGEFGVSSGAEEVYRVLVRLRHATRAELGSLGVVPEDELDAAISELGALGLTAESASGWSAVPPERAVELLIHREEQVLAARRARLDQARDSIPLLVADYVDGSRTFVSDRVELLDDPDVVRSRLFQLTQQAKRSAWSMSPGGALSPDAVDSSIPLDTDLASRGVSSRMIVSTSSLGPTHWNEYLTSIQALGHEVRASDTVTLRAIIIDEEIGVIPDTESVRPGAYVLHGKALVAPLVALFEEVWDASTPWAEDEDRVAGQFSEAKLRQVAVLLFKGHKDEAIARRLGVSIRTMRRLISATFDELQANGRFQAGARAVERGWVGSDSEVEPPGSGSVTAPTS